MYNKLQKHFSSLVFFAKILIIAGAYYVISDKLLNDGSFNGILWRDRLETLGSRGFSFLILILGFSVINWMLEILKWKSLAQHVSPISFSKAAKQSLASLTASLLTPNRIGEYGAKAIYYSKANRPKVMMLNFMGNVFQMLITTLFGIVGLLVLGDMLLLPSISGASIQILFGAIALCFIFILVFRSKWETKFQRIIKSFLKIPYSIHKKTFLLAVGRYLIFSHQFYLMLLFFGVDLQYHVAMPLIMSMYIISSVIPGFVIFDWLVKGSVAVTLFRLFGVDEIVILSITASMWILNFAIPAIVGSFYVLTFDRRTLVYSETEPKE